MYLDTNSIANGMEEHEIDRRNISKITLHKANFQSRAFLNNSETSGF
jgi:hypothetical protein